MSEFEDIVEGLRDERSYAIRVHESCRCADCDEDTVRALGNALGDLISASGRFLNWLDQPLELVPEFETDETWSG